MAAVPRGLIVAAPASGSGKTVLTLGLARALRQRGLSVATAKVGPDYIDPAFHAAASGRPCVSLDTWAMRDASLAALIGGLSGDVALIEGAMGLFDGAAVRDRAADGSTASLAARTGWPVALVLDVSGQSASVAAVAQGFVGHRPDVRVAGLVLNRTGGPGHEAALKQALREALPTVPVLGSAPRAKALELPRRYLGLAQAREHAALDAFLDAAAALAAQRVDLDALLAAAAPAVFPRVKGAALFPPPGQRVAVAHDDACAFSYASVLEGWRRAGAETLRFSPLADEAPAPDADAVYLPGGYPELHAGRLAANAMFLNGLRAAAARGAAVFGECGGYMILGEGLVDAGGARHQMAGLLPLTTSLAARKLHLGYRRLRARCDGFWGAPGDRLRAHEFHYAAIVEERENEADRLFDATDAQGAARPPMGLRRGTVAGSFAHLLDRSTGESARAGGAKTSTMVSQPSHS